MFSKLWEECTQEEAILVWREENLGNDEYKALIVHARKEKRRKKFHPLKKFQKVHNSQKAQRDYSNYKYYSL